MGETSPFGAMFSSFMLNLRRFYRTSMIEIYLGNGLAERLTYRDLYSFYSRCRELDTGLAGFFTATELQKLLKEQGHGEVADAMNAQFLRPHRHPGESYIDYSSLLDSVFLRQELLFEEALWRCWDRAEEDLRGRGTASQRVNGE